MDDVIIKKTLKWFRRIEPIQMRVANTNNPRKYFIPCIHWPGFGKINTMLGNKETNRYGAAIPTPIQKNIAIITKKDCVNATVIAVPTKGAEQGVASTVAKKPLKKSVK